MPALPPSPDERDRMDIDGGGNFGGIGVGGIGLGGGGFVPTYGVGGQAQPWQGQPQGGPWSPIRRFGGRGAGSVWGQQGGGGGGIMELLQGLMGGGGGGGQMAQGRGGAMPFGASMSGMEGGGGQMAQAGGRMAAPTGNNFAETMLRQFRMPGGLQAAQPQPQGGGFSSGGVAGGLIENAFGRMDPNYGGMFGFNPPEAIMQGVRQRAISDAGAQERAARLGLQSRGDADPSTYGFQALMSQLGGQRNVNESLGNADLGLRQQQLQQYWNLLNALMGQSNQQEMAHIGSRSGQGQDWLGGALGGLGSLAGGIFGKRK